MWLVQLGYLFIYINYFISINLSLKLKSPMWPVANVLASEYGEELIASAVPLLETGKPGTRVCLGAGSKHSWHITQEKSILQNYMVEK